MPPKTAFPPPHLVTIYLLVITEETLSQTCEHGPFFRIFPGLWSRSNLHCVTNDPSLVFVYELSLPPTFSCGIQTQYFS